MADAVRHHWWLFLLRGVAALAFGVLTLFWPGATLVVLTAFIAAYALVDGIVALMYAFRLRPMFDRWWVLLVQGLISAAFGVFAFINPTLSLLYIVVSVCLWMLFASMALFMLGRAQRAMGASPVWSTVGAVLSLVLAILAVVYPGLTLAGVLALIAWFALALGIVHLVVAFRVRAWVRATATA
ncbi:MAG TPA: DUF308 domain-containing protein [Gemmatimonadales bacterium]|nr:DUF308 domain-containing protein [Gemmatimonadales bacterium]